MTDFADFCASIADYANRQDWSPQLVTSFVRDAEQKFNAELRVDRMIQDETALIASRCAPIPDGWLEFISDSGVKFQNSNAPDGFLPLRYMPSDQFFNSVDTRAYGYYTIKARQIYFGGTPDAVNGIQYKLAYYGEVPVFADDTPSWIYTKYPSLYRYAALINADLHAVGEEQSAANMKQLAEDMIQKLNADHLRAKASGSRLKRTRVRTFG